MRDPTGILQSPSRLHFRWPTTLDLSSMGRQRGGAKRNAQPAGPERVAALQRSFAVGESIQALRRHRFRWSDLQYFGLAFFTLFSLWIIEARAPLIKTAAAAGYFLLLLMPATRQFFLPSWPIWTYLLYFFSSRYVATSLSAVLLMGGACGARASLWGFPPPPQARRPLRHGQPPP